MRKYLPNLIFLTLLTCIISLFLFLFKRFDLGVTVEALGGVMTAAGLFSFIFFLSIDPGYAWTKSVNFNTNYVIMTVAGIIFIAGVALLSIGNNIHSLAVKEKDENIRCRSMVSGKVENVAGKDWYKLHDSRILGKLSAYLFRKRGGNEKYKVVVVNSARNQAPSIQQVMVSSKFIAQPIIIKEREGVCASVFEHDLKLDRMRLKQEGKEDSIGFDLMVTYHETESACDSIESNSLRLAAR